MNEDEDKKKDRSAGVWTIIIENCWANKELRAGDAHLHEDEEGRKRPRSARECAEAHSFLVWKWPVLEACSLYLTSLEVFAV